MFEACVFGGSCSRAIGSIHTLSPYSLSRCAAVLRHGASAWRTSTAVDCSSAHMCTASPFTTDIVDGVRSGLHPRRVKNPLHTSRIRNPRRNPRHTCRVRNPPADEAHTWQPLAVVEVGKHPPEAVGGKRQRAAEEPRQPREDEAQRHEVAVDRRQHVGEDKQLRVAEEDNQQHAAGVDKRPRVAEVGGALVRVPEAAAMVRIIILEGAKGSNAQHVWPRTTGPYTCLR